VDLHLAQLRKWRRSISPDAIVYQWFYNDLRMGKQECRPRSRRSQPWRRFFLAHFLIQRSYLFFFLDYEIPRFFPSDKPRLVEFLLADVRAEGPCWQEFVKTFKEWTIEARSATPRVLVAL
jgi:hypothetical protein